MAAMLAMSSVAWAGRIMILAAVALDPQAVLLHRGEMRAARDKGDIRPGLGESRAVDRADAAGADDRDAHASLPREPIFADGDLL